MRSRLTKLSLSLALIGVLIGFAAGPAAAQDPAAESITQVLIDEGFSVAVTALTATGQDVTLANCDSGAPQFTVFAPNDDAFTNDLAAFGIPSGTLLGNTDAVAAILGYHLLPEASDAAAVVALDGTDVATVEGETIKIVVVGETVTIESASPLTANVVTTDIQACNGVIHEIDHILFPATVATALGLGAPPLANTGATSDTLVIAALSVVAAGALIVTAGRRMALRG